MAGLLGAPGLMAAALLVPACGPSQVVNRAYVEVDAAPAVDGPMGFPPSSQPPRPTNGTQPPPIDPPGAPSGFACTANGGCLSRNCVEGICCETACEGLCHSCDQPGSLGTCKPVPAGEDPDEECAEEPASSCGRDGACDGAGACRLRPANSVCLAGGCKDANEWAPSLCDGKGTCQAGTTKSCAPAECVGDSCAPPCATDPDCPTGRWCDNGTCRVQREQGMPCERATQCGSGFCTDGVCCNMACGATCYSCNQEGALGVCQAIPDQQDPGRECPVQGIVTCGNAGGCNGRGACRKHVMGTFCAHGGCMNRMQFGNSTCDGMGTCRRGPGRSCGNYACNGAVACWTVCSTASECAPGRTCNVHACQ